MGGGAMPENVAFLIMTLLVLAFVAFFGYFFWWYRFGEGKRQRETAEKLQRERGALVRARGWRYDDKADRDIRYRIHGRTEGGVAWQIHYDSDLSSSSSSPKLIFTADSFASRGYVWAICDRKTFDVVSSKMVRGVIGGIVAAVSLFSDKAAASSEFFSNAKDLDAGSRTFREHFVLLAQDGRWKPLIDGEIERGVLNWPAFKQSMSMRDNCFSASLESQGLVVKLYADTPSFEVISHMAKLGQSLAEKTAAIGAKR
jgi:hypothetical protein